MADQSQNPKNDQNPLFKALTRLFSGPIVNFREQGRIRYKRGDLNMYTGKFQSLSGKAFKKSQHNPYDYINTALLQNQNRNERYLDFDQMEFTAEIASALDIYADEMTTYNDYRKILNIESPNEEIREILTTLFYDVLGIESNLYSWCRTMCKYGDFFLYLDLDETTGIRSVIGIPTQEIERLEGQDKSNPNYVQYQWNSAGLTLEYWQIAHFRILGQDKYAPYGTSVLEGARRIWRQLVLLEDAMMAYRIVRAPERRVFYIDMGSIPPNEYEQHIQRIQTQMKRNQVVDASTGRVDLRYNPMSIEEDYYIPVRGGQSGTKIDTLQGGQFTAAIDDVKYLQNKLFAAIKIPQSYLSRGEGAAEEKSTLSLKDIRFAKTVQRLQSVMVAELQKIAFVHLYVLGYRNADLINFKLKLNNPSKIAELQELEHFKAQLDAADAAKEMFSRQWIFKNIFKLNDEVFQQVHNQRYYDKLIDKQLEALGGEGGEGGGTGLLGGLGGGGGEMPTEMPSETPEMPASPESAEATAAAGQAPEEPTKPPEGSENLLASPPAAKREDGSYTTAGARGKMYTPVNVDKRPQGARTRHFSRMAVPETAVNTTRNVFPGYSELKTQSLGIMNEAMDREERLISTVEKTLNGLAERLEKKKNESQ